MEAQFAGSLQLFQLFDVELSLCFRQSNFRSPERKKVKSTEDLSSIFSYAKKIGKFSDNPSTLRGYLRLC